MPYFGQFLLYLFPNKYLHLGGARGLQNYK